MDELIRGSPQLKLWKGFSNTNISLCSKAAHFPSFIFRSDSPISQKTDRTKRNWFPSLSPYTAHTLTHTHDNPIPFEWRKKSTSHHHHIKPGNFQFRFKSKGRLGEGFCCCCFAAERENWNVYYSGLSRFCPNHMYSTHSWKDFKSIWCMHARLSYPISEMNLKFSPFCSVCLFNSTIGTQ